MSGSSDNTSRIWSLKTLECLHVLEGHTDAVNTVAIKVTLVIHKKMLLFQNPSLKQDSFIVTGCSDSVVRIYDVCSGQCLK